MTGVAKRDAAWFEANPWSRISHQRLATHRRCPSWYRHVYLEWHKSGAPARFAGGHIVEETLVEVLDGRPDPAIATFPELRDRALVRARSVFDRRLAEHEDEFLGDPNAVGEWDVDPDRLWSFVERGIEFHLRVVYDYRDFLVGRPIAEAWEDARPDHDDGSRELDVIPEGYFQGLPDLVYTTPDGARKIVDLKAYQGDDDHLVPDVEDQLREYAYLDWKAGRGLPESLEAWFLGRDEPVSVPVPTEDQLRALDDEILRLLEISGTYHDGFGGWDLADFLPEPSDPSWCAHCPARWSCPKGAEAPPEGDRPSATGVRGLVLGIGAPQEKGPGRVTRRLTLVNTAGTWSFTWDDDHVNRLVMGGVRVGALVELAGLRPWSPPGGGDPIFYATRATRVESVVTPTEIPA